MRRATAIDESAARENRVPARVGDLRRSVIGRASQLRDATPRRLVSVHLQAPVLRAEMDLPGRLSNPILQRSWVNLAAELDALRLGGRAARPSGRPGRVRRRGEVRGVIDRLLREADEPMRAGEIHRAVERDLGETVSWSSIANCLRRNSAHDHGRFEKVGLGVYRRREGPSSGQIGHPQPWHPH